MKVPLTISDFLRRGALVYPDRLALIDEPGTAGSLGTITYRSLERRARGLAIALDEMGVGHGERVAIVSPNAARFGIAFYGISGYGRVLVPVNYRLNADEVSYVVEHSGASVLLVDPESDEALRDVKAKHRIVLDGVDDEQLFAEASDDAEPGRLGARRGRDRQHQLHERHHGAAQGRATDPPQLLAERGDLRLADDSDRS